MKGAFSRVGNRKMVLWFRKGCPEPPGRGAGGGWRWGGRRDGALRPVCRQRGFVCMQVVPGECWWGSSLGGSVERYSVIDPGSSTLCPFCALYLLKKN